MFIALLNKIPMNLQCNKTITAYFGLKKRFKFKDVSTKINEELDEKKDYAKYDPYPTYKSQSPYREKPSIRTCYYNKLFFKGTKSFNFLFNKPIKQKFSHIYKINYLIKSVFLLPFIRFLRFDL